MPAITDQSTQPPLLKTGRMNHGTLHCHDIGKTRQFYEEVLGIEVIQSSPASLMIRKGGDYVYAVVEAPVQYDMNMLNHNGFEVETEAEVDAAHEQIMRIKDQWGLKQVTPIRKSHGDYTFYFMDFDGNWWEIVAIRKGGYVADFDDKKNWDLTGRHDLDAWVEAFPKKILHTHDPLARDVIEGRGEA